MASGQPATNFVLDIAHLRHCDLNSIRLECLQERDAENALVGQDPCSHRNLRLVRMLNGRARANRPVNVLLRVHCVTPCVRLLHEHGNGGEGHYGVRV